MVTTPGRFSDEGSNVSAARNGGHMVPRRKLFQEFFLCPEAFQNPVYSCQERAVQFTKWPLEINSLEAEIRVGTLHLVNLMNGILREYKLHETRRFFKTNIRKVYTGRATVTSPSILLAGSGPEFMNTEVHRPFAQYAQGIAACEVRKQSTNSTQGYDRLAVHSHEIFSDQENRRYTFGLVLTELTVTACLFDHSGAVFSDPLDYHLYPDQFCAIIPGLASSDGWRLDFDQTLFREGRIPKVRTNECANSGTTRNKSHGTVYTIKEALFRFRTVVGNGTLCWLVRDDRTDKEYVVKDSWVASERLVGKEPEASFLRYAQEKGISKGVAQIHHFEEVHIGGSKTKSVDSVAHNRRINDVLDGGVDRVHSRLVLSTYGKPLDLFSSPLELLFAYHDAVQAHRDLHENAGILHRDVSVRNILIKPDGEEGDRGVLIDFDNAIRIGDTSPYSTKRRIGTWPYFSRNVLADGPHTYINDLESFYYTLCSIVAGHQSPGVPRVARPALLLGWEEEDALAIKEGYIIGPRGFTLPVGAWFGEPIRALCVRLHAFFKTCHRAVEDAEANGRTPASQLPSAVYEEFLQYIRQVISETDSDEFRATNELQKPFDDGKGAAVEELPEVVEQVRYPKKNIPIATAPVERPRRSVARYTT